MKNFLLTLKLIFGFEKLFLIKFYEPNPFEPYLKRKNRQISFLERNLQGTKMHRYKK